MMTSDISFTENVLKAFKDIIREIEKGSSEHDIRYRFVKYFLEGCLSYEPRYIKWEKKRADLTIIDENNFAVIKIETKRPTENIDRADYEEQAFKYEEETTRYIGLTNFLRFKLWEVKNTGRELKVNLDFSKILEQRKPAERLSTEEKTQILFLNNLTKETLFDPSKYEKFDETYGRIDITKEGGFKKLLERLNFIADNLLFGYTLKAFGEYKEGYNKYRVELDKLDRELNDKNNDRELKHNIVRYRQKIENEYKKYTSFDGFELWKYYSGKEEVPDDDVKEIFCKESIYVLLNKLLFIRICEDKGLLPKNLSNGGIEILRQRTIHEETAYKEILNFAFGIASGLYSHFYETGILDWFRTGDGELNELLNRVLWILNQFDFTHVDRDILGNLYEKYLPSAERKKLGEFYTPVEVIDYILTSVGYTYSHDIETKDILDPACGSGGFLVRATRRLISRYLMKFGKANKRELRDPKNWKEIVGRLTPDEAKIILDAIQEQIYGLDINPFACHIAEMNMLFQIIDLYQKAREKHKDYKLGRFKICRTDSLEKLAQKQIWDYGHQAFLEEQDEIDDIKKKKFDFVVGNPPYVRVQRLSNEDKQKYAETYKTAEKNYDIYVLFFERGVRWLKDGGLLSFVCSNRFTTVNYGEKLREFLLQNTIIEEFVDFKDTGVFKDVLNYPSIITLRKGISKGYFTKVCIFKKKDAKISEKELTYLIKRDIRKLHTIKDHFENEYFETFGTTSKTLSSKGFYFIPQYKQRLLEKWNNINFTLKDLSATKKESSALFEGSSTGYKDLYVLKPIKKGGFYAIVKCPIDGREYKIEKELIKTYVEDAGKWAPKYENMVLIFPYQKIDDKYQLIQENTLKNKYPLCWQYLDEHKDKLKTRKSLKTSVWYAYSAPRSLESYGITKLLIQGFSVYSSVSIDENGNVFFGPDIYGLPIKEDYKHLTKYFLALLNSNITNFFIRQVGVIHGSGYYKFEDRFIKRLPIKLPETVKEKQIANQIIKKVDEILELHKKAGILDIEEILKGQETQKLYNLPSVSFSIKDNAKFEKIEIKASKIFINSEDYVRIKDKKIRDFVAIYLNSVEEKLRKAKDVKSIIYNIEIPKSEEILKEIIKKGSFDRADVKNKIKELEREINELVYEIYGITKNEQKIIERE
ncbi:MAG: N-6 DNA methylase [Methanosarcinales archaeon]|nr:MAG: N-6 DNA methylase [Methanosarcinales archaeon]